MFAIIVATLAKWLVVNDRSKDIISTNDYAHMTFENIPALFNLQAALCGLEISTSVVIKGD